MVAELLPHHLPERSEELDDHRLGDPAIDSFDSIRVEERSKNCQL